MSIIDRIQTALSFGNQSQQFQWPARIVTPGAMVPDYERIRDYIRFQEIYLGRFDLAFPDEPQFQSGQGNPARATTTANVSVRAVEMLHAAIWTGDPPKPSHADEASAEFALDVIRQASVGEAVSDSLRSAILYGDGCMTVNLRNGKICVQSIHPGSYYVEIEQPYINEPVSHNIVWPIDQDNQAFAKDAYTFNAVTGTWFRTRTQFDRSSGVETQPLDVEDLGIPFCPVIHTYGLKLPGFFWGKASMADVQRVIAEYALAYIKLGRITEMASTKALLAAPYDAFDEQGNIIWDTDRPYMVQDNDMATFDKAHFGWLTPPGLNLVEPLTITLNSLEREVMHAFGVSDTIINPASSGVRDVGAPGLELLALLLTFTVRRYQTAYSDFLNDLMNVAAAYARVHMGVELPPEYQTFTWDWPEYDPNAEGNKIGKLTAEQALGLPKTEALRQLGYENPEALAAAQGAEINGQFILPPAVTESELDSVVREIVDN